MKLIAKNISKNYKDVSVLKDLNLIVNEGEFLAINGASGSGKTTLLSILASLDKPTSGEVYLNELNLHKLNNIELSNIRNTHFGFVFQSANMIMHLNVKENISLPLTYSKIILNDKEIDKRVNLLLERVGLSGYVNKKINELSGGEQQRVALARALINEPNIIFADEPTGNLDSNNTFIILNMLKELSFLGKIVIVVTHDPIVSNYANKIINLKKI